MDEGGIMRILNTIVVTAWVSLMPVPSAAQNGSGLSDSEVRKINEVSEAFARAVVARDWKTIAGLYADDAVLYPPGESAVKGRAGIEACLIGLPPMKDFKLRNTKVDGREDLAYIQGTYMMTEAAAGASEPGQQSGYFLEIRRRQPDGRWLIAVHMLTPHR
jgi:uncharacterized protein (TIGR02246 family)